jgi:hypothetical protein
VRLVVESQIKGSFKGWKGGNVFKLMNGEYLRKMEAKHKHTIVNA